jgi:hypothetical protein
MLGEKLQATGSEDQPGTFVREGHSARVYTIVKGKATHDCESTVGSGPGVVTIARSLSQFSSLYFPSSLERHFLPLN